MKSMAMRELDTARSGSAVVHAIARAQVYDLARCAIYPLAGMKPLADLPRERVER